jgi:DNA primase
VLVEGFFGAMAVHHAGFPCVVALMGATISQEQVALLVGRVRRVVILLDGDPAGRAATDVVCDRLHGRVVTRIAWCPLGQQPDRLTTDELLSVLS